jgi:hypothetical protein
MLLRNNCTVCAECSLPEKRRLERLEGTGPAPDFLKLGEVASPLFLMHFLIDDPVPKHEVFVHAV